MKINELGNVPFSRQLMLELLKEYSTFSRSEQSNTQFTEKSNKKVAAPACLSYLSAGTAGGQGGQKGHKGSKLNKVPNPDEVILHDVRECECCNALLPEEGEVKSRQIFDVPKIKIKATEHKSE